MSNEHSIKHKKGDCRKTLTNTGVIQISVSNKSEKSPGTAHFLLSWEISNSMLGAGLTNVAIPLLS